MPRPRDEAPLLPFQPRPRTTLVSHFPRPSPDSTAITRRFQAGEMVHCSRCRVCIGADDVCTLIVNRVVPDAEAEDFGDAGFVRPAKDAPLVIGRSS